MLFNLFLHYILWIFQVVKIIGRGGGGQNDMFPPPPPPPPYKYIYYFCRYIWGSCPPNTKKLATLVDTATLTKWQVKAMYDTWQWTFGTLFKLLIFNHIDHVYHYFRRIWPLHADDMHSILTLNCYLSFETGFSRFRIIFLPLAVQCVYLINHALRTLLVSCACQRVELWVRVHVLAPGPCTPLASGFAEAPGRAPPEFQQPMLALALSSLQAR